MSVRSPTEDSFGGEFDLNGTLGAQPVNHEVRAEDLEGGGLVIQHPETIEVWRNEEMRAAMTRLKHVFNEEPLDIETEVCADLPCPVVLQT